MAPPYYPQSLDLSMYLNRLNPPPMSYQEFLAARGGMPQQQMQPKIDYSSFISKMPEDAAQSKLQDAMFASGATSGAGAAGAEATTFAGGAQVAGTAVGSAPGGGTLMSTGAIVPASEGAPVASSVAPATGIMANAAELGAGPLAAIAAGTYLGGKSAYNLLKGKADNSLAGKAGRVTLGVATGGLSEIARPFLIRKTTRDIAKKHTKDLLSQNKDDPVYQNFVQGMRGQYNSAPPDPSKPFAGKYRTFDEYQKAGLEANDLTGVLGNLRLGSRYTALTPEQKVAATQRFIDANLYHSKKGEVDFTDQNKANQIFEDFLSNGAKVVSQKPNSVTNLNSTLNKIDFSKAIPVVRGGGSATQNNINQQEGTPFNVNGNVLQAANLPAQIMIPRSKTKSPGIGLDGKPYNYGRK